MLVARRQNGCAVAAQWQQQPQRQETSLVPTRTAASAIGAGQAMPTLSANGIRIAFDTAGDAKSTPLLLLHDAGMQLTAWPDEFVDGLVELGFYVIRFDHRDCGLSTKFERGGRPNRAWNWLKSTLKLPLRAPYGLEDMAMDALGVLSALGIARAHLVGVAMGAMVAHIVAARHPQRVLSLTSIMSSSSRRGLPGPTPQARQALLRRPADPDDVEAIVDASAPDWLACTKITGIWMFGSAETPSFR